MASWFVVLQQQSTCAANPLEMSRLCDRLDVGRPETLIRLAHEGHRGDCVEGRST